MLAGKADATVSAANGDTAMSLAKNGGLTDIVRLLKAGPSVAGVSTKASLLEVPAIEGVQNVVLGRGEKGE